MDVFGIMGFIFSLAALVLALSAQTRINKLEKELKENSVLKEEFQSEE